MAEDVLYKGKPIDELTPAELQEAHHHMAQLMAQETDRNLLELMRLAQHAEGHQQGSTYGYRKDHHVEVVTRQRC